MPKVASSSLSEVVIPHLKELKAPKKFPFPQAEVWARAGRMRDREEYLSQYNTTTTFFITRHPLARLASAYRNKLQPDTRTVEYFIKTYGRAISEAARGSWREGDPDPTFREFVRFLVGSSVACVEIIGPLLGRRIVTEHNEDEENDENDKRALEASLAQLCALQ